MNSRWAVIGGGMLGSVSALRLAEAGHKVTVFEGQPTLGGLTSQLSHDQMTWDRFYHVIEHVDQHLLDLLAELKLSDKLVWRTTKTNFYDGSEIYPLNNAIDYLRLPALNLLDKLRIGLTILYGASIKDGRNLEHIELEEWLCKWSGKSAFDSLWLPLLRGKLGDNYKIASAAFIWSVIQRFYGARSGANKTESFGYVQGGYATILQHLEHRLVERGVAIKASQRIESIERKDDRLLISSNNERFEFDKILISTPSNSIEKMCPVLTPHEKTLHAELRYQGVVCVSLLLHKPLGGAYLTYITEKNLPFTTIIEMTTLVDTQDYNGLNLVYLPKYIPADHPLFDESDKNISDEFVDGLRGIFPYLSPEQIVCAKVSRARHVTTIPTIGYSENVPRITTSIPGLYICNSAQITNAALSVNESVRLANHAIASIARDA